MSLSTMGGRGGRTYTQDGEVRERGAVYLQFISSIKYQIFLFQIS